MFKSVKKGVPRFQPRYAISSRHICNVPIHWWCTFRIPFLFTSMNCCLFIWIFHTPWYTNITMENCHLTFIVFPIKKVIFQSYVNVYQRFNLHFPHSFPFMFPFSHGFSCDFPIFPWLFLPGFRCSPASVRNKLEALASKRRMRLPFQWRCDAPRVSWTRRV